MSVEVGRTFNTNKTQVLNAATLLFEKIDSSTGQIQLLHFYTFLDSINLSLTDVARETLQAIFGCEKNSSHTISRNGTDIDDPYINIDALSICLLAAIPIMCGDKNLPDYLPSITHLPLIKSLAKELIEHVAHMLQLESEVTNEADGTRRFFSENVVLGLDRIFVMISGAFEDIVGDDWRAKAKETLQKLQSGMHSMHEAHLNNEEVMVAIEEFSESLTDMLDRGEVDAVQFLDRNKNFARKVRRASLSLDPQEVTRQLSEMGVGFEVAEEEEGGFLKREGLRKMKDIEEVVVGSSIKNYDPDDRIKKDAALKDVDDFLRRLMK